LTAKEIVDGTMLAVWEHMRRLFWLAVVLGLFFILTGSSWAPGGICALITGTLVCALIAQHGILCSLSAQTLPAALVPAFAFPLVITAGTPMLLIFEGGSGVVLLVGSIALLLIAKYCIRRSLNTATASFYFIAVHLFLACVMTFWTVL